MALRKNEFRQSSTASTRRSARRLLFFASSLVVPKMYSCLSVGGALDLGFDLLRRARTILFDRL